MRPERNARHVLSTTRATAKMHEFRAPAEDFIDLPRDPSVLFSLAVGILGDVAAAIAIELIEAGGIVTTRDDPIPEGWVEGEISPRTALVFSAMFFDAFLGSRLDETITVEFSLLCAASYYLGGNVGSAAVIIRRMEQPEIDLAAGLGRLVHAILQNSHYAIEGDYPYQEFGNAISLALRNFFALEREANSVIEACEMLRDHCYNNGSPRELLYADVIVALCAHKLRNAARTLLPEYSELNVDAWRPALGKKHFPTELWPAQERIAAKGLLKGKSAIIQMPTSAGKTRATELVIRSAFLSGRASLSVIVAPYRSLCHDIRGDLSAAFDGEDVALTEASDAYQVDIALEQIVAQKTVLIVTPEKLLYMLRRAPELADRIGLVVYDEGHQFDGMTRGPTYELLLTSLRIALPLNTQVILISAVIGNAAQVAEWLIKDGDAVVDGEGLLPTTKSIAFASWQHARGSIEYVSPVDPDDREYFVPRIIASIPLANRGRETSERRFPNKDGGDVGLFLGLHLVPNGSVALFCGLKASAVKLCRRLVEIFERGAEFDRPISISNLDEVERIRALSEAHLGPQASATRAASLGVFAHHADTPQGLRLSIEHAMKEGLANFVICTSTLAQGVNFPIKYLIVTTTQQGGERILVRDLHNLIGRAGRAGMHTEGSVIFSSPSIYDERRTGFHGRRKWDVQKQLLDPSNAEPCKSSILAIFDAYEQRGVPPIVQELRPEWLDLAFADRARIEAVVAEALAVQPNIKAAEFRKYIEERAKAIQSIATFLLAHIVFGEEDAVDQVNTLASNTLAYHLADEATRVKLVEVFQGIAKSVSDKTDSALQIIIRKSPLPPATVIELHEWLLENLFELSVAVAEDSLLNFVSEKILSYSSARSIRNISDRSVVPGALTAWVDGATFVTIFGLLAEANIKVSGDRITVEDAVSLGENGFGYDIAMMVASLADLLEPMDDALCGAMAALQKRVKYGLSNVPAIAFFEAGFSDRVVASALGQQWPHVTDRAGVRSSCRQEGNAMSQALSPFPLYFLNVASELGR